MNGPIKFYSDEHIHSAVAAGLRRRGVDVLTTKEAVMFSATDVEPNSVAEESLPRCGIIPSALLLRSFPAV